MSQPSHPTFSQSAATGVDPPNQLPSPCQGPPDVIGRVEQTLTEVEAACREIGDQRHCAFGLSVIVPVFNERDTLPKILDRIDEVMPEGTQTVVVDDASTDGTAQWLAALPPRPNRTILLRGRNHGKGSAVRMGMRHSRGDIVAIQDADTEYDPIDLLDVIQPIQQGQADVVYGSRYLGESDDPSMFHRLGNWALTAISNCMTGQQLTDMETCHKAFRGELVRSIRIKECRFGFEPEITGKIAERGIAIAEVPTGYQYRSYDEGKKITWKDGIAALACMWRYRNAGWLRRAVAGAGRVLIRLPRLACKKVA
ncbi:Undecaprenyl-phosphate mannosyltransferase [Stieleria neptunia]|uniref:Undecaprenyl-phosphate mannosyltransferase n=1 Tax=Stieleria neptunia TaxID=2527979 RepID=A0A518HSC8_9BACT|nr:glycosyltransferase family 2 protein [Stieleria neptunia]QDV43759.1 Undecaprenyl-phosphate mannosyltransferase [Stieleria neptunia]